MLIASTIISTRRCPASRARTSTVLPQLHASLMIKSPGRIGRPRIATRFQVGDPKAWSRYRVKPMRIGEVAARSGCPPETVRYYERIGLLPAPPRTASGYRDYRPADADRLRFISRGRELGFSLAEIRSLLGLAEDDGLSCQDVDRL